MNRRDFLRLAGLLPLSVAWPRTPRILSGAAGQQNVIIIVFDAFSAYNISLYGYQRETTPNLARLSKRGIVYHNHFAASNFTTSGTASLLTGTLPWTHRAIRNNGRVSKSFTMRTIFDAFSDYYRIAYTHNDWAFTLLNQFRSEIDELVAQQKLMLASYDSFAGALFQNDQDTAAVSWTRDMKLEDGYTYSLFLSHLHQMLQNRQLASLKQLFPRGLPTSGFDDAFLLEQATDWLASTATNIPRPFLGYFHFLPPHDPYRAPLEYVGRFSSDGYQPIDKPVDEFALGRVARSLPKWRSAYDEFILYVDREFGRLYNRLEASGLLENTWLVLTSDHGELLERGLLGHNSFTLYQPLVRIPLLIFEPSRRAGLDIDAPTSAVDVLPTLAHVTGHTVPAWSEGAILPPFGNSIMDPHRSLYAMRASRNDPEAPFTKASVTLVKGRYKLLYYFGYVDLGVPDHAKLFDIQADPEEMTDLFLREKDIAGSLLDELKTKLKEVNRPYVSG